MPGRRGEEELTMVGFMFRNLKGYRFLVVIAVVMTIAQVGANILLAFPLKWILDKIVHDKSVPPKTTDTQNLQTFLNGIFIFFDSFGTTRGLPAGQVHTVLGVILFSTAALIVFGIVSAILAYIELYLAAYIAQNLSARLRKQLFAHLERLSLDWHGKQKKGDLVHRIQGNIPTLNNPSPNRLLNLLHPPFPYSA